MPHTRFFLAAMAFALMFGCAPAPLPTAPLLSPSPQSTQTADPATVTPIRTVTVTPVPMTSTPISPSSTVMATPAPTTAAATSTPLPSTATRPAETPTEVVEHAIPPNFPLASLEMTDNDGKWTLTFAGDYTFQLNLKAALASRGTFDVIGDQLIVHDTAGTKSCRAAQGNGTYQWSVDGSTMKLHRVTDNCSNRAGTLNGSVWTILR